MLSSNRSHWEEKRNTLSCSWVWFINLCSSICCRLTVNPLASLCECEQSAKLPSAGQRQALRRGRGHRPLLEHADRAEVLQQVSSHIGKDKNMATLELYTKVSLYIYLPIYIYIYISGMQFNLAFRISPSDDRLVGSLFLNPFIDWFQITQINICKEFRFIC